jgi:23S rRNA (cytosine1962-C5)-methyltransferase
MRGPVLRLKRGRERWHPWIFKGDVADVSDVEAGAAVTVLDAGGRFLGRGLFNPRPALCCRILTREDEPIDGEFLRRRVAAALAFRTRRPSREGVPVAGPTAAAWRVVWSEADGLPGLVVDRYGPVLVLQCGTLGMARMRGDVVAALREALEDLPVFSADEPGPAGLEGFAPVHGWLDRAGPATVDIEEGDVRFRVTVGRGQKTGLYLDQAGNRLRAARLAARTDVLDVFAYAAGFACHALRAGAASALCLESSPEAIAQARVNLEINGVDRRAEIRQVNAFDELRRLEHEGRRFGLIVLDPPPFARGRTTLEAAARGYKDVNLRAMRLLAPGGSLLTFSCSHHVSAGDLEAICRDAASDAAITLRVIAPLSQAPDHPVLLTVPETRYLKGLLLETL